MKPPAPVLGRNKTRPRLAWLPEHDAAIREMRANHKTWDEVAVVLGVSRFSAIEHSRKIGRIPVWTPPRKARPPDDDRKPLPPGHPLSWDLINKGLSIEGIPYPFKVFL